MSMRSRQQKLDDATLISILRCPATRQALVRAEDGSMTTLDGNRRYQVVEGVPVLIDPERSLFAPDAEAFAADTDGSRLTKIAESSRSALKRLVPSISRNVKAQENFRDLASRLADQRVGASDPRVLVVGGAAQGAGLEQLSCSPVVTLETDVVIGPRTQVACDAHDLPFADGSFDAVVCQGVLGFVVDPSRVVAEIHRVLSPNGLVYSETNFLQGVCMGPYDFTRHTHAGHRRLFREFEELSSGVQCGPGMALAWTVVWFFKVLAGRSSIARAAARGIVPFFVFWLPYLDRYLVDQPGAYDAASGTFFLGRRATEAVPDAEIIRGYRGAAPTQWLRDAQEYVADTVRAGR